MDFEHALVSRVLVHCFFYYCFVRSLRFPPSSYAFELTVMFARFSVDLVEGWGPRS